MKIELLLFERYISTIKEIFFIPSGIQGMGEILPGISSLNGYLFILKDHRSM